MSVEKNATSTINIALTSYPRRIINCAKIISSALENTVVPDRIYLTLSAKEFPKYEQSLPSDLYRLAMTSNKVILNWVDENFKSMKKVFPILPYLEDDDIIIDIDDDMILPKDFIESRMKDFKDNGCEHPISSNLCKTMNIDSLVMSAYSLFTKRMLSGYERLVTDTVLNTFNDDRTYLYLFHLNGYTLKPCTKWCVGAATGSNIQKLNLNPSSGYQYKVGQNYDNAVAQVVADLCEGKSIGECFGWFKTHEQKRKTKVDKKVEAEAKELSLAKSVVVGQTEISQNISDMFQYNPAKPMKHDLVYVLGKGSKWNNMEIKISITSMLKFCSHWIGEIYVVGENSRIRNPKVHHIQAPDITKANKDANIIHKILTAIWKIPSLTDNFLFCSDDILVTKKSDWEDFAPRYVFEYRQADVYRNALREQAKNNPWDFLLIKTLDRFVGYREHIYFYEPHIHAPINKRYFKQMCKQIDYTNNRNVMIMSLWFNWLNLQNPQPRFDHRSVFSANVPDVASIQERHLTYNDKSFGVKKFRDQLIELVTMEEFK